MDYGDFISDIFRFAFIVRLASNHVLVINHSANRSAVVDHLQALLKTVPRLILFPV